ncbi:pyridoxamine 5'-phosphate oxidase family protein [Kitasatospora sp. NBC_01250]|uniref:helix-turn-helix domain-containing protein n=1 Tax=unclassified Kitasatospora TaxID=2633591 RepID=UPI002E13E33A|nr:MULTISPECIES: pyridoxamine 5'-phosphate oxidase family protein [unclassified Kitasatospora]WSJ64970.1 pyridoxamine 5'-phosphate oxidase family protein [Kitasatospora sp. NBC_01302]
MHPDPAPTSAALARRIADRSAELGLTEARLAAKAGMSPQYLTLLIEAGTAFDPSGFLRLAAALELTYQELLEGRRDAAPGSGGPAPHPVLSRLTGTECWERLGTHGVGRVVVPAEPAPQVFPVNYTVDAHTVVYRTAPHSAPAAAPGSTLSFQVDRINDHLSQGWSVLIAGTAQPIEDAATIGRLALLPGTEPWAGGNRPLWIRITPDRISGRRVGPG